MLTPAINDWDAAYANGRFIVDAESYPPKWTHAAAEFRAIRASRSEIDVAYGDGDRLKIDMFFPDADVRGLVVFIHGGYWKAFDKSSWSHLAAGPLSKGWAVALPSYRLCPAARISGIVADCAAAVTFAANRVTGPIRLTGHSAGGHLVARLAAAPSPLAPNVLTRLERVVPISPIGDLRPLLRTTMNADLRIDEDEARRESPALLSPATSAELLCWVGGAERQEFRRQSALLASMWRGFGLSTGTVEAPDAHHFDVIDALSDPSSPLTSALCE